MSTVYLIRTISEGLWYNIPDLADRLLKRLTFGLESSL